MMKYTPEPWTIDRKANLSHGASVLIRTGSIGIAEVWKTDDKISRFEDDPTAEGNASLLVNAAAMFKALEAVLQLAGDGDLPDNGEFSGAAITDIIRAAYAKVVERR